MTTSSETEEIAIITGASTGIGAATARKLAQRGFHVLAGVRREKDADSIRTAGIEPVILDITDSDHIDALAARVRDDPHARTVRALINNAAIGVNVPIETYPIDKWRSLFEVNLFGHIAVTQAILPALVSSKGRVVNISSVGGRVAMATYGPYAATKFALEAVSDSLRRELASVGVQVVVIEPGAVRSEMAGRVIDTAQEFASIMTAEQDERYGPLIHAINAQTEAHSSSGLPAEFAADVIARAVTARKPRTRYTVGREASLIRFTRFLPDRTLDRALAAALRPHFPEGRGRRDLSAARGQR